MKDPPSDHTIRSVFGEFVQSGYVHDASRSGRPACISEVSEEIQTLVKEQPATSTRSLASLVGASHTTVHTILLHHLHLKPYKIQVHQKLDEEDFSLRVAACEEMLQRIQDDQEFLQKLITSYESSFHLDGVVNRHNCRIRG